MATEVEAIYHNGALELQSSLPLKEGERVRVLVLPRNGEREAQVKAWHQTADDWLAQQPSVTEAPAYSPEEWARLDEEWDRLFSEILAAAPEPAEAEIETDVEAAVQAARRRLRAQ